MADKRVCSQLPILNLVVLLLTLSVLGNNEDVLNFFDLNLERRQISESNAMTSLR